MGRGRNGFFLQGNKKNKRSRVLLKEERFAVPHSKKRTPNQTIIDLPEEFLNAFRQMNPRDVANILVDN